jgi:IS5 family transposase
MHFRRLLETNDLAPAIAATVNAHPSAKGLLLCQGTIANATNILAC